MQLEFDRVKKELEAMQRMKQEYDELRKNHQKLQVENEEVRGPLRFPDCVEAMDHANAKCIRFVRFHRFGAS